MEEASGQLFIKQENCGEDSTHKCTQEEVMAAKENTRELGADATDQQTSASRSAEEVGDELRSRRAVWEHTHMDEREAMLPVVKLERPELGLEEQLRTAEEKVLHTIPACTGSSPDRTQGQMVKGTEELPETQWSEYDLHKQSELQGVLKVLSEKHLMEQEPLYTEPDPSADVQNKLGCAYLTFEAVAQQKTFLRQGSSHPDALTLAVKSQPQLVPAVGEAATLGLSPAWRPDLVGINSDPQPPQTADRRTTEESSSDTPETPANEVTPRVKDLFVSQNDKLHSRVGDKEKRFFCKFCGKGFNFPKQMEIHQRVHTGEKPFSCAQCRKQFSHSGNLKRHQRVHTGEKPFSCSQCDKRFSHLHQLKMHERVHSGERPFCCTFCGKRYAERSYLRIHQQRKHSTLLGTR